MRGPTGGWATIPRVTVSPATLRRALLGVTAASMIALSACSTTTTDSRSAASPSVSESASASASPSESASPTVSISPSADLSAITVSDEDTPVITFDAPWAISSTQTKVLREGGSQVVGDTATVTVNYVGVNGRTGEIFDSSYERGESTSFPLDQVITGFKTGLAGQAVGSRVLIGIPSEDGYPDGTSTGTIEAGDSLLFVVDILSSSFDEATGTAVDPVDGLPTVTMTDDGPTIAIADGDKAPSKLVSQILIKGPGAKVKEDSTVTVKYRSWNYADPDTIFEDAWTSQTGELANLIDGWKEGLVGKTAGSRVLLVVPPAQAYPDGLPSATPSLAAGQTLVYVIDILDVAETATS